MNPTIKQVHVDKILTNIAVAYRQTNWLWEQVFPTIPVKFDSDKYYKFTKGDWFRDEAALRAPGTRAELSGFSVSTDSYSADEKAIATKIPDRVMQNTDNPLALRIAKTNFVTDRVMLARERELAAMVFKASTWGSADCSLAATWDSNSSTPIEDFILAQDTVAGNTGMEINLGVIGRQVWSKLRRHPDILDVLSSTERQIATPMLLAQAFDIAKILIGKAIYNTAAEGQTDSYSYIWGKSAWFGFVTPSPGIMTPTAGYTFSSRPMRVRRWYDEPEEAEYIEASDILDYKAVCTDVGYYIPSAVA